MREKEVGEEHPLVAKALRAGNPYELCWCGSGRKFKWCHWSREKEEALTVGKVLHETDRIFWRDRGCMDPRASELLCSGKVIDAHTIQRKGPLQKIIGDDNHVCQLANRAGDGITLENIGWKKASTFPGYCSKHDAEIFDALERSPFTGTHEQCVLQTYRNVCNELYKKHAVIESLEYQRTVIDRGCDSAEQINRQLSVYESIIGQEKARDELESVRRNFDDAVTEGRYDLFLSKCYFFKGDLSITSAGALNAEHDFHGELLMDLWDLSLDAEMLSHSIMATDEGGAIVFTWLASQKLPAAVVASFDKVANNDKGDIFSQYCFLNCENTYFAKKWWEQLTPSQQAQLKQYAATMYYEGGSFVRSEDSLVNWDFET